MFIVRLSSPYVRVIYFNMIFCDVMYRIILQTIGYGDIPIKQPGTKVLYVPILLHAISLKPNWEHLKIN